jgi:hypothetical protein
VFVAFPIHGVLWPQSMGAAIQALVRGGTFRMEGSPWLDSVRSELVGQFLETKEDILFFIDADNWFGQEVVDGLLAAKGDVVTATYRKREPPHQYVVAPIGWPKPPMRKLQDGRRLIEIERDGLGCCLIRRHVIERLWESHPELAYVSPAGAKRRNLFEYGIYTDSDGIRRAGQEDRAFFKRVRDAGFKVECLIDATVMHGGVPGRFAEAYDEERRLRGSTG